jgi:hypothetical protein
MSLNFTVQKLEEYKSLPDGVYTAQLEHIEYFRGDYGNYHIVNWKILRPSEFEGKIHQERFNVEHESDQVRNIAIQSFSRFCMEIGGLKEGDDPKAEDFLYKIASITIRNKPGKDGRTFANVINRKLEDANKPQDPAHTVLNPQPKTGVVESLNDVVPF